MPRCALCAVVLLDACALALTQRLAPFETAVASSTYSASEYSASDAIAKGSGYWCSSGGHSPSQVVTWAGLLGARQRASGVKINWAYGPGEYKILASSDGGNFEDVTEWRSSHRPEVSYEEVVLFDAPRSVQALTIAMRSPMPWGYFGLNDVALLAEPGPALFLSGSPSEGGELCLAVSGGSLVVEKCLEAIARGEGKEIFSFTSKSQIESTVDGRCVALANGDAAAGKLTLQDCEAAEEAGDGRSIFELTAAGQLKAKGMGNYCVMFRPDGVVVRDCEAAAGSVVALAAVPEFDASAASVVRDLASVLKASAKRQHALLAQLQDVMPALETCSFALAQNFSHAPGRLLSLAGISSKRVVAEWDDPAVQAIAKIDGALDVDLADAKSLIKESATALGAIASKAISVA